MTYIISLKKELRRIIKQLNSYNSFQNEKKIDVSLFSKEVEQLGESINKCIDISRQEKLKEVKLQNKLKELVSNISHDLRTPLTSISGYVQLVRSKKLEDEKRDRYFEIIRRRIEVLQELLNSFFMLSVIEAPEYTIETEILDMKEIFCDTIADFYEDFYKRGIEPEIVLSEEEIKIFGDKNASKRVLENLLNNSLKYSDGDISIKLGVEKSKVILSLVNRVKDFNLKDTEKLFDKFYIGNEARNIDGDSTGLGLAIVKNLMEKMDGEILGTIIDHKLHINCYFNRA